MSTHTRGQLAAALLVFGTLFAGLAFVLGGIGDHVYDRASVPPRLVALTQGNEYHLATRGGVADLAARGIEAAKVQCTVTEQNNTTHQVALAAEGEGSRAVHIVARFLAPVRAGCRFSARSSGRRLC